ncbi:defective in cullin neddylation protein AAR3-like isoform X10 [Macadamia integrifolia]|uniref:defective in cullin neddylation protein AAR3-like isoform X10 n=1 Tax=Macadamia integrifolia TaxID=60698 RepID=UPI001C4F273B|nr:defective in cullin neddylation protein AAR3-like isoform X10 [Macadamia integrifolia]
MDSSDLNRFDIFEIYQRYCVDITSGNKHASSREELAQLLKLVESGVQRSGRNLIFVDLSKLMAQLNFMVDSCEFTRFYDFVFFVCRQNGQKNITVCRALAAWRKIKGIISLKILGNKFWPSADVYMKILKVMILKVLGRSLSTTLLNICTESLDQRVTAISAVVVTVNQKLDHVYLMILYQDLMSFPG